MPFADAQSSGKVNALVAAISISLSGTVTKGDLVGYSGGWKRADSDLAAGPIVPVVVALKDGVSGDIIKACAVAIVGERYSGGTDGAAMYCSGSPGQITDSEPGASAYRGRVGVMLSSSKAILDLPAIQQAHRLFISHIIDSSAVDAHFFVATQKVKVKDIQACPTVAGTDAGAVSATVTRCQGVEAPPNGDDLLGATKINLKGTADTVQDPALTDTVANLILSAGDRLAVDVTGALTAVVCVVTVELEIVEG